MRVRRPILAAYLIGSQATGKARPDSDMDVALVIVPVKGKDSLHYTEAFHHHYRSNREMPEWNGRRVDFQFFYPGEVRLAEAIEIAQSKVTPSDSLP